MINVFVKAIFENSKMANYYVSLIKNKFKTITDTKLKQVTEASRYQAFAQVNFLGDYPENNQIAGTTGSINEWAYTKNPIPPRVSECEIEICCSEQEVNEIIEFLNQCGAQNISQE